MVVVVSGNDGALPAVVAGLVEAPVIAVPTSVGYGASLSGIAPLLAALTASSPGVSVVNIDNGSTSLSVSLFLFPLSYGCQILETFCFKGSR